MRISELSARSGVPIPRIKYYIREGLIRSDQDPGAEGAQAVVDQIQLIRGLVHVVGLSIRQVRQILALVRDPELSPAALMTGATVTLPLTGPRAADVDEALAVNVDEWKAELPLIEEWFEFIGDKLPTGLRDEFEALKQRLG